MKSSSNAFSNSIVTGEKRNSRRKSFKESENSFQETISVASTRSFLNVSRGSLVRWFYENHTSKSSFLNLITEKDGLDLISRKIQEWCWSRHDNFLKDIKVKVDQSIEDLLNGYNSAILSEEFAQQGLVHDETDKRLWLNYAVKIKEIKSAFPSRLDLDYNVIFQEIRDSAYDYYHKTLDDSLNNMVPDDLCNVLYYVTQLPSAALLHDMIITRVFDRCSPEMIKTEVTPKFMLLCCISPDEDAVNWLDSFLTRFKPDVDVNAINAAVEFASYNLNSSCFELLITRDTNILITIEGMICSLLGIILVGNLQLLPIIIALVTEKVQNALLIKIQKGISSSQEELAEDWTLYIAPFIYIFFLLILEGSEKETIFPEMFDFFQNTFKKLLTNHMQPTLTHSKFTDAIFLKACDSNLPHIVDLLLKYQWAPPDLTNSLLRAAEVRHQKVFSTMLFSLLTPDPNVKCMAGAIPTVFSKPKVLRALPFLGKTFPTEISYFLAQLSYIPAPICVPINRDTDAFCKSKPVRGIRLGCSRLHDVLNRPMAGTPNDFIWENLTFEGTLHKSAPKSRDTNQEVDSVVCMLPLCLITDSALGDASQRKSNFGETNALIRLLELSDEDITLQPISKVLVEFHWSQANVWRRVVLKFFFLFAFFACIICTFILIAKKQTEKVSDIRLQAMGWTTFTLSTLLLVQEFRQISNVLREYINSMGNFFDLVIHSIVSYVIISGIFLNNDVPILLMAITIITAAVRSLSHIGIIPTMGPLYRSWEMAFVNAVPLAIPMGTMILSYSFAIFVAEHGKPTVHFNTIYKSIQTCLEMATWNYNGLDNVDNPEIFTLKVLFHTTFIVFFVNLIVAIMTVNLAQCFSNANDAFFLQISSTMVELELYWLFPSQYGLIIHDDFEDDTQEFKHGYKIDNGWPTRQKIKKTFPLLNDTEKSKDTSVAADNDEYKIMLYSCPVDKVKDSIWWNNFPRKTKNDKTTPIILSPPHENLSSKPSLKNASTLLKRANTSFRGRGDSAGRQHSLLDLVKEEPFDVSEINTPQNKAGLFRKASKVNALDRFRPLSDTNALVGRKDSTRKPSVITRKLLEIYSSSASGDNPSSDMIEKLANIVESHQRMQHESESRIMKDIQDIKIQVSLIFEAMNTTKIPTTIASMEKEEDKIVTISDFE